MRVTKITTHCFLKYPSQPWGNVDLGDSWEIELNEGDDPVAVREHHQELIRESIRKQLAPIGKRNYEMFVKPMLENHMSPDEVKEIEQRMGINIAIHNMTPEISVITTETK